MTLPTPDELRTFLKTIYKHDRLEGRERDVPGYVDAVVSSHLEDLARNGWGVISRHESRIAEAVCYDAALQILERMPKQRRAPAPPRGPSDDTL